MELGREREWPRESSLALKLGQMKGSAMPIIATAIAITPTIASTDRLCGLVGEFVRCSRSNKEGKGRANAVIEKYVKIKGRSWTKGMVSGGASQVYRHDFHVIQRTMEGQLCQRAMGSSRAGIVLS